MVTWGGVQGGPRHTYMEQLVINFVVEEKICSVKSVDDAPHAPTLASLRRRKITRPKSRTMPGSRMCLSMTNGQQPWHVLSRTTHHIPLWNLNPTWKTRSHGAPDSYCCPGLKTTTRDTFSMACFFDNLWQLCNRGIQLPDFILSSFHFWNPASSSSSALASASTPYPLPISAS